MKCPLTDEEIGEIIRDSAGAMSEVKAIATAAYRKGAEDAGLWAVEAEHKSYMSLVDGGKGDHVQSFLASCDIEDYIRAKLAEMEEEA